MSLDNQYNYWNSVAERKTFTHPVDISLLGEFVSKEAFIIDFGCGYGRVISILNEKGYHNISGYDTSIALINRGKNNNLANLFHISSPTDLPLEDNAVDCILLFAVLTCIPANQAQLELIRVLHSKLKPAGIIYISDYYLQAHSDEMERYEYLNEDKTNYGVFTLAEGVTFRHHTREWIATLLSSFEIKAEKEIEVMTMNGNKAEAFQMIVQKRCV
jgi:SAM-dependent methyltransferase